MRPPEGPLDVGQPLDAPAPRPDRYMLVACPLLLLVSCPSLAVFGLELTRQRLYGNQASAVAALRRIATAEATFREGDKDGDGKHDYGTLAELSSATLVDEILGSGAGRGYTFVAVPSTKDPERAWLATASPVAPARPVRPIRWR